MGFLSGSAAQSASPPPVTRDRLVDLFERRQWKYFIDNEGDLGGNWDDNQFYFLLRGADREILHVQGMWHTTPGIDRLEEVRAFVEQWHREHLWPKCYHRIADDGRIRVFCENTVDHEKGASDEQLLQQIHCALGTAASFFDELGHALNL